MQATYLPTRPSNVKPILQTKAESLSPESFSLYTMGMNPEALSWWEGRGLICSLMVGPMGLSKIDSREPKVGKVVGFAKRKYCQTYQAY